MMQLEQAAQSVQLTPPILPHVQLAMIALDRFRSLLRVRSIRLWRS